MLGGGGGSLRSLPQDVELKGEDGPEELRGYRKAAAAAEGPPKAGMMQKRVGGGGGGKGPGGVAAPRAAELRVFRAAGGPAASNLRKQKSLTNLSFLTDSEKKLQLYEPKWSDDMAKAAKGGGGGGRGLKGGKEPPPPPLSRNLSRSEHSLFPAKLAPAAGPKPLAPLPSSLGKPSRIPRGPYAEVKPLSKAADGPGSGDDDPKSDDEILASKGKKAGPPPLPQQQQPPAGPATGPAATTAGGQPGGKGAPPSAAEEKAFLKVDPELVVTVLGDLEQLLFSQMLAYADPILLEMQDEEIAWSTRFFTLLTFFTSWRH
ncbi:UNVERIFIED_CONTAM: hypothetical protein K2H54_061836 [Gekko kuhli]